MNLNQYIMNLTERKERLIRQRESLETIKKEAHEGILAINSKIRKLDTIIAHAEEALKDETEPQEK